MFADLSHGPEAFGLVRFLLLGAQSLQEHQLHEKPAPARTPENTNISAPLRLCLCLSSLTTQSFVQPVKDELQAQTALHHNSNACLYTSNSHQAAS